MLMWERSEKELLVRVISTYNPPDAPSCLGRCLRARVGGVGRLPCLSGSTGREHTPFHPPARGQPVSIPACPITETVELRHSATVRMICCPAKSGRVSYVDCMIAALILGSLHGESHVSPYYLSNRMSRTISTKPAYSLRFLEERRLSALKRDAFAVVRSRLAYRYESEPPAAGLYLRWTCEN